MIKRRTVKVPIFTEWVSYTPTGSWSTNTTYTGRWRRVGDTMEVRVTVTLGGAPDAVALTINLPTGYSIDTNKIPSNSSDNTILGYGQGGDTGVKTLPHLVTISSSTAVKVYHFVDSAATYISTGATDNDEPYSHNTGDTIGVTFSVPIVGWKAVRSI